MFFNTNGYFIVYIGSTLRNGGIGVGNSTGNPGVSQANPYPYPQNPVPVARVWGIAGTGHGFFTSAIVAYLMLRDISKSNLCQVIVSYLC